MKKNVPLLILLFFGLSTCSLHAQEVKVGFVNAEGAVEKSKYGKREKNAYEALRKQLSDNLEKLGNEVNQLDKKSKDKDYLDGISPAAEAELKQKLAKLGEEFMNNQNQSYQLLQQAKFKMLQNLHELVCKASELVRENLKLSYVLSDESAFAYAPSLDVTDDVVREMDIRFDRENQSTQQATGK